MPCIYFGTVSSAQCSVFYNHDNTIVRLHTWYITMSVSSSVLDLIELLRVRAAHRKKGSLLHEHCKLTSNILGFFDDSVF